MDPSGGNNNNSNSNSNGVSAMYLQQQQPMPMPMSVQAMAGLMYATAVEGADSGGGVTGVSGVVAGAAASSRPSPMQSLMPANFSNPNLFNLGLLAAQAEAQMQQQQQQQQQQMLAHHQQQQQQQQLSSQDANGGDSTTTTSSNRDIERLVCPY